MTEIERKNSGSWEKNFPHGCQNCILNLRRNLVAINLRKVTKLFRNYFEIQILSNFCLVTYNAVLTSLLEIPHPEFSKKISLKYRKHTNLHKFLSFHKNISPEMLLWTRGMQFHNPMKNTAFNFQKNFHARVFKIFLEVFEKTFFSKFPIRRS